MTRIGSPLGHRLACGRGHDTSSAAGVILCTVGCTPLGYGFGASWWLAERWLGRLGLVLALGIAAVALFARQRARARAGRRNTA